MGVLIWLVLLLPTVGAQTTRPTTLPAFVSGKLPVYPPLAQTARIQGQVLLRVLTDGAVVRDVQVLTGSPMLNDAARESVLTWRFVPHSPTTFDVTIRFELRQPECDVRPPIPLTFRVTEVDVLAHSGLLCDPKVPIGRDVLSPVPQPTAEVWATATRVSAFSPHARANGIDGDVRIELVGCTSMRPLAGPGELVDAALADLKEWKLWCTGENARSEVTFKYRWLPADCAADQRPLIRIDGLVVDIVERRPANCGNLRVLSVSA